MLTLAAKLRHLVRLLPADRRSVRKISAAIKALPGHTRGGSHAAINNLLSGADDNPTVTTLVALSQVLKVPAPFLLPGWDDVKTLTVLQGRGEVAEIVRHLDGLSGEDLAGVLAYVKEQRSVAGLPVNSNPIPIEPYGTDDANQKDPRRRSAEESAKYAADSLEGL